MFRKISGNFSIETVFLFGQVFKSGLIDGFGATVVGTQGNIALIFARYKILNITLIKIRYG
jgi:hypothetical protein